MSNAAPAFNFSNSVPAFARNPVSRHARLHQMLPGRLFRLRDDRNHALALLSHSQLGVMDGQTIWCVVILADPRSTYQPGALISAPRDSLVDLLLVQEPMRLAVVD